MAADVFIRKKRMTMSQILQQFKNYKYVALVLLLLLFLVPESFAQGIPGLNVGKGPGGGQTYSLSIELLILLTSLTFLPSIVLMMTSFTRIIIVLSLLRSALGTQGSPPNQVLIGLALFMTLFIMSPVIEEIYTKSYQPLSANQISSSEAMEKAAVPLKDFMLKQTRQTDLALYIKMANMPSIQDANDVPFKILVPAFVTSELKTAFQIGFTIFIPFLIIDMVVASVLMAMGMMMVPPSIVSLPFKLMLFVLVDGWQLLLGSLAQSFL